MTPAQVVLLGVALPALIGGVCALAWGLLSDNETPATQRPWWVAPPAFFLAFVCVLGATDAITPDLWPTNAANRTLAIGLIALAAGMAGALAPWRVVSPLAACAGAAAAAWVPAGALHPQTIGTPQLLTTMALAGLLCGAAVWVFDRWDAEGGWLAPMGLAFVAGGATGVLFLGNASETALHAGLPASFLVAWGLVRIFVPRASVARGGTTTFAVLLAGLLAMGHSLGYPPAPGLSYVLVLAAIGAVGVGIRLGLGRGWLVRMTLVIVVTAVPMGAAGALAFARSERASEDGDDDDGGWSEYDENLPGDG